ncbi:MAG: LicD family protein [Clostridia bacterium]|nr:LicD family protein [Clostridia bacterium]
MREIHNIVEIRELLLKAAETVKSICEDNGLEIFMGGGTLLGAIRHKGFIPWDDDIDLYMKRPDYDKFIEIMRQNNNGRYRLECHEIDKNYLYPFGKFIDTNTILKEKGADSGIEMGLYVDIFPIDGLGADVKAAKKQMKKINPYIVMNLSLLVEPFRKGVPFTKNMAIAMIRVVAKMFGGDKLQKKISAIAHACSYETSVYAGQYMEATGDKRIFNKQEIYEDLKPMKFENTTFLATQNWDKYLSQTYGDYMTPPPKDKQVFTHAYKLYIKEEE